MEKGVNVIITDDKNRVLVLKRNLGVKDSPGLWDLPGGRIEENENLINAIVRETKEETNFNIRKASSPFYVYRYPNTEIYAVKTQFNKRDILKIDRKEHAEFKWVSKDDWKRLRYTPSVLDTIKRFFQ